MIGLFYERLVLRHCGSQIIISDKEIMFSTDFRLFVVTEPLIVGDLCPLSALPLGLPVNNLHRQMSVLYVSPYVSSTLN